MQFETAAGERRRGARNVAGGPAKSGVVAIACLGGSHFSHTVAAG